MILVLSFLEICNLAEVAIDVDEYSAACEADLNVVEMDLASFPHNLHETAEVMIELELQ